MAVSATINFTCPICNQRSTGTADVPEIAWASSDKLSDLISEDDIVVECRACGELFDAHVQNSPSHCTVTLDEHPQAQVSAIASLSPIDNGEWINTEVASDPHTIFMDSYHHVGEILAEYGEGGSGILPHSAHLIHRMVFVQQISALEAYLGDTLVKQVLSSPDAMHALLRGDAYLKELKLPLLTIAQNQQIVKSTVQEHLQSLLYHNLAKVAVLYRLALHVEIWPDKSTKEELFVAVSRRHDYIHRNGRSKDGKAVPELTRDYVSRAIESMRRLVDHVESQITMAS